MNNKLGQLWRPNGQRWLAKTLTELDTKTDTNGLSPTLSQYLSLVYKATYMYKWYCYERLDVTGLFSVSVTTRRGLDLNRFPNRQTLLPFSNYGRLTVIWCPVWRLQHEISVTAALLHHELTDNNSIWLKKKLSTCDIRPQTYILEQQWQIFQKFNIFIDNKKNIQCQ